MGKNDGWPLRRLSFETWEITTFQKENFLSQTHTHPTVLPERHGSFIFLSLASLGLDQISLWEFDFLRKNNWKTFFRVYKSTSPNHIYRIIFCFIFVCEERENVYKNPIVPSSTPSRGLFSMFYFFCYYFSKKIKRNIQIWWEFSTSWLLLAHCHNIDFSPADSWRVESTDKEKDRVSSIVISFHSREKKTIKIEKNPNGKRTAS